MCIKKSDPHSKLVFLHVITMSSNSPIGIWHSRRKLGCSSTTENIEKEGSDYAPLFRNNCTQAVCLYVLTTRTKLIFAVLDVVSMELWLSHEGLATCFFLVLFVYAEASTELI
jgi:hypothetical protein